MIRTLKAFDPPTSYVQGTLQRVHHKSPAWVYSDHNLGVYSNLLLNKLDAIQLPLIKVYEILAEHKEGLTVGYLFISTTKRVKSAANFISVCSLAKEDFSLEQLTRNDINLQLRYKLNDISLFSLGVQGALVTLTTSNATLDIINS